MHDVARLLQTADEQWQNSLKCDDLVSEYRPFTLWIIRNTNLLDKPPPTEMLYNLLECDSVRDETCPENAAYIISLSVIPLKENYISYRCGILKKILNLFFFYFPSDCIFCATICLPTLGNLDIALFNRYDRWEQQQE